MKLEKSLKKFLFSKEKRIAHCYPSFYLEDSTQANVWKGGRCSKAQLYSEAIIDTGHTVFVKTADIIEQLALSNGEGLFAQCQAITFEACFRCFQ